MISQWWASLAPIMKVLWAVTLSASLIFLIQTILTFIGAGSSNDLDFDGGTDADFDLNGPDAIDAPHGGINLYTFRNLVNFILGFGWTVILLQGKISSAPVLIFVATLIGVALVAIVMAMFKWLSGMQQSGNINVYTSAVGCQGNVYLTIPAERSGFGKVQISINNAIREYDAVTDGDEIKTGTPIKVTEVVNESTLLVEELNSLII